MERKHYGLFLFLAALLVFSPAAFAAEMQHGSMPGMKGGHSMEGHGDMKAGGHGKMGDGIFSGKIGAWQGDARLIDMKAQMEKAKASGMKMEGAMKSHHLAFTVTDPKTKKAVTDGKGTVTVTGPDKKAVKTDLMAMSGHFGADIDLPKPGKYAFEVSIESAGAKGSAKFPYTLK